MRNPTIERAQRALTHPISVAAIVLLLVNDHLLRWRWPSWWTGKIGDVAWLIFAPPLVAVLLAWLAPRAVQRRSARLGWLAFILTGGTFALVKTVPQVHGLFQASYNWLLPWDSMLRRDPTDLLALPALLIAAWVWIQPRFRGATTSLPRHAWLVVSVATLATIANSAAPDLGITCLTVTDDRILAYNTYSYYQLFTSQDGGLNWQTIEVEEAPVDLEGCDTHPPTGWILETPDARYRFVRGERIDRSTDGGQTWQVEIELQNSQARMAYYRKIRASASTEEPYPTDALLDPASGHVIAAMGQDGVLVRTPEDGWRWVPVGNYRFEPPTRLGQIATLLQSELLLAVLLVFLLFNIQYARGTSRWLLPVLIIGWLLWIATTLWRPALQSGYNEFITVFLNIGAGLFTVPLSIFHIVQLIRKKRKLLLWHVLLLIAAGLLFSIPFVGWALGILPQYNAALIISLAITLIFAAAGIYNAVKKGGND